MVDAVAVFGIGIAYSIAMMSIRVGVVRGIFLELQKTTKARAEESYNKFEAIIYAIKKKDRDPQQALNHAAEYFSWSKIINELNRLYTSNRAELSLDILGIILSIGYAVAGYPGIRADAQSVIHFGALAAVGAASLILFISALFQIGEIENKLGIGVVKHRFNFLSRMRD